MTKTVSGTTTIEAQYGYDPYGIATKLQGSQDADFQYAGYYMHAPSGLNFTRTRQYSAAFGRWISRDPIHEKGGANLFGYVVNDPISNYDPSGLLTLRGSASINVPRGYVRPTFSGFGKWTSLPSILGKGLTGRSLGFGVGSGARCKGGEENGNEDGGDDGGGGGGGGDDDDLNGAYTIPPDPNAKNYEDCIKNCANGWIYGILHKADPAQAMAAWIRCLHNCGPGGGGGKPIEEPEGEEKHPQDGSNVIHLNGQNRRKKAA